MMWKNLKKEKQRSHSATKTIILIISHFKISSQQKLVRRTTELLIDLFYRELYDKIFLQKW